MLGTTSNANCPDDDALLAFVEGQLTADRLPSLAAHLDGCAVCRELVEVALARPEGLSLRDARATMTLARATTAHRPRSGSWADSPSTPLRTRTSTFSPGDLVAGRYRVVQFLGAGGMGDVFAAEDTVVGGRVALKTLTEEVATDPDALSRLKQEVRLARLITDRNVCRVYDLGFHHGPAGQGRAPVAFLTMELVDGETLGQRIRRKGRIESTEALVMATQMVAALEAAHQVGVTHRDFKSDNVLVQDVGGGLRIAVTDFGLAYCASSSKSQRLTLNSRAVIGTAAYMAPEQVGGGAVSSAADYYALGVVLFEMLTATLPFVGPTPMATAAKRLVQAPPPLRSLAKDTEDGWEEIVRGLLRRDPQARMAFVSQRLRRQLSQLSQRPAGASAPERSERHNRFGRRVMGIAASSGLLILGGLAMHRAAAPRPPSEARPATLAGSSTSVTLSSTALSPTEGSLASSATAALQAGPPQNASSPAEGPLTSAAPYPSPATAPGSRPRTRVTSRRATTHVGAGAVAPAAALRGVRESAPPATHTDDDDEALDAFAPHP